MMNVTKILISLVVIALGCALQNVLNTKRSRRIRQFPMIIAAGVLMAAGMAWWTSHSEWVDKVIADFSFLLNSNLLIMNASLLLGFVLLKLVLRPIVSAVCKKQTALESFSMAIYDYDDEYDEWFLKKQWINFREYVLGLVCGMVFASGLYLGFTWLLGAESPLWMTVFPCVALVILNEIYGYINGQTREEFTLTFAGKEADSRRVSNYYKLREILEQLLPAPLLSAYTGCEFIGKETAADIIRELKASERPEDQVTAEYFELNGRYKTADADCVQAALDMMHRRNVVFFSPFYRDMGMYITLPLIRALLSGKKCAVLCGRRSAAEDVKQWMTELLSEYSRMRSLWRVKYLSDKEPECEVGILTFTQIYDKQILAANKRFLNETDFVLLIEPSVMLNTGQVALSIIAEEMNLNAEKPVYCICDRYTDGLIDTMSHLLHAEITDVVAMPVPRCNYTAMSWDVDGDFSRQHLFDKQTRYLGNGIELAAIAVKNQIPNVTWYSEKKVPVKDIKWISGQYYSTICRYMNQPSQQKNLYEKIRFVSNLWSADKAKEHFVIAEDEFCNMFNIMRAYLSRGENQVFVNVLSENYLLRDYMRCNRQMFMSDPNAIPSYVPDYAKTERNTILKLILMMTLRPVSEEEVLTELHLIGLDSDDAYRTILNLLDKYTFAEDSLFTVRSVRKSVDEFTTVATNVFSVSEEEFNKYFSETLKNAYYILENEENEQGYIDSKLFNHVTQTVLPGQFVTYDGKYYQVKYVSPQSGVVLRRASNLFDGRKYYRQIRSYFFESRFEIAAIRTVMDVEFAELVTDFRVETTGYLEMNDNHNLRTARRIDFTADPSVSSYARNYRNKSVLRIHFPEADDKICFTMCLLFSEVFRTVFPDGWQYLAAVTKRPEDIDGMLNYVVYPAFGDMEDGYIYIIEDSEVDLGLLDAVEKHFMKLMEIIADFLDWHSEKMREPASEDPVPAKIQMEEAEESKRRNLVVRMLARIRSLFGGKKEEEFRIESAEELEQSVEESEQNAVKPEAETDDMPDTDREPSEEIPKEKEPESIEKEKDYEETFEPEGYGDPDFIHIDGTDIFDNEGMPEDNAYLELSFQEIGLSPIRKSRYQKECYLKFGYEEIDSRIQVEELKRYLRVRGWSSNALTLARKRDVLVKKMLDVDTENHCDFCSLPLTGISYERLNDGRIRCNDCSSSAITTLDDFREIFYRCLELMEDFFEIRYRVPISVKVADAREVAKGIGMIFRPSKDVALRVLGYAQKQRGKYSLVMENGSPRLAAIDTIVHEMTHIWQYLNWDDKDVRRVYGMANPPCTAKARDIVYEGMAMWASIQYLYQIGETYYAAQQEALAEVRQDVYGIGFRMYRDQYPLVKDSSLLKYTPFAVFPTVEPTVVKNAVRSICKEKRCVC